MKISENIVTTRKQTSTRRQESSRLNGAKSRGPVTTEGKEKVRMNAVKHGALAKLVTLNSEEEIAFREIHQRYVLRFEPRDQAEFDLVEQIVWANWKMRKIWIHETSVIGLQIALDRDKVNMEWINPVETDRQTLGIIEALKESNALELFSRYSRSLSSQAERATKMLLELKKLRLPPAVVPPIPETHFDGASNVSERSEAQEPNKPSPISEHPETDLEEPVAYVQTAPEPVRQRPGSATDSRQLTTPALEPPMESAA
jgi:hypothetical protein